MALLLLGAICFFFLGHLLLLIAAFRVSFWWGVFSFFFPPVLWLFVILNWSKAWRSLLVQLLGVLMGLAFFLQMGELGLQQFQQVFVRQHTFATSTGTLPSQSVPDDGYSANTAAQVPQAANGGFNKCEDSQGHVTYTRDACEGKGEPLPTLPAKGSGAE
jgi:hypothetical protein